MSKISYVVDVDRFVCSELEEIRKMYETRDFSGLLATVERIQHHVNNMEEGLYARRGQVQKISDICDKEDLKNKEKIDKIKEYAKKVLKREDDD